MLSSVSKDVQTLLCGSVAADEVDAYLNREGPWEELEAALGADPAPRCDDCTFPDE